MSTVNQLVSLQSRMFSAGLAPGDVSIPFAAPLGGTALLFDGDGDCLRIPYPKTGTGPHKSFNMTGDYTLELWVRASSETSAASGSYQDGTEKGYVAIACQWANNNIPYPFAVWYDTSTGYAMASRYAGGIGGAITRVTTTARLDDGYYHRIIVSRYTDGADQAYLQLAVDARYWALADNVGVLDSERDTEDITVGQLNGGSSGPVYSAFRGAVSRVSLWRQGFSMAATGDFVWGDAKADKITMKPRASAQTPPTPASVAVGQWLLNEGYGAMAFDRAGLNHGRLEIVPQPVPPTPGGPTWVVSSALDAHRKVTPAGA